jgi:hypothetical protein
MIFIPDLIWNKMLQEFRRRWRRVEQVAYLDGIEFRDVGIVTTLTFPNARLGRGNFSISAASMSEAGQHLDQLVRLAQVHTHPSEWVGHSEIDDELAYSHHDGAVSIVLPNYGKSDFSISDLGVHICQAKNWRELSGSEKKDFLQFIPSFFDYRK